MDHDAPASATGAPPPDAALVLSAEHLVAATRWQPARRLRVSKKVVTEEQTITVTVRREELVVEELPLALPPGDEPSSHPQDELAGQSATAPTAGPVLEMVLAREVVQLVTVPHERVRVVLDNVADVREVSADVGREEVDLVVDRTARGDDLRTTTATRP